MTGIALDQRYEWSCCAEQFDNAYNKVKAVISNKVDAVMADAKGYLCVGDYASAKAAHDKQIFWQVDFFHFLEPLKDKIACNFREHKAVVTIIPSTFDYEAIEVVKDFIRAIDGICDFDEERRILAVAPQLVLRSGYVYKEGVR